MLAAGCDGQQFVGGLPVGDPVPTNAQFVDFAIATLDTEVADHAAVTSVAMYRPDFRTPDGSMILFTRSGGMGDYVVALTLADDSVHAYFVMCGAGLDTKRCFIGPPSID